MGYVDGFVIPVQKKNLESYRRLSRRAGKVWLEHGALDYKECAGNDLAIKGSASFTKTLGLKRGETVVFSWILYRSRKHRDRVNAKVMADPRIGKMMEGREMPFEVTRMLFGGFEVFVDLGGKATPRRPARRRPAAKKAPAAKRAPGAKKAPGSKKAPAARKGAAGSPRRAGRGTSRKGSR